MTIEVRVENKGQQRNLEVQEIDKDQDSRSQRIISVTELKPGTSRTFYVHLLRDLIVREVKP